MSGLFVGVDGSDHSRRALGWALREAARHQVPLTVISVRPYPARPATEIYWPVPDIPADARDEEAALKSLQQFVDRVASETGEAVPGISLVAEKGDPAEALIRASRDADLQVVGSRGSGGFARLPLGSVSTKVVHHAACPVVVIS